MAHLERFKRYPAAAEMRRQQGTTMVHLTLLPDGRVRGVRLQGSVGSPSLDEEALALVERAQPLPVPPGMAAARDLVLPIRFSLRR